MLRLPGRFASVMLLLLLVLTLPVLASPLPLAAQPPPTPKPTPEVQALLDEGKAAAQAYKNEEALRLYEAALAKARQLQDRTGEADSLKNIGIVYRDTSQPQKALDYFQQALPIRRQVGDKGGEANTLNNIGIVYSSLGQPQKALENYEQALPLFRQVGDRGGEAATLTNLGLVYADLGQPRKALEYYQQALPIHRRVGNKRFEANTLYDIGIVCYSLGQSRKALEYFQQALTIRRQVGDNEREANTLNNLGIVYKGLGQPQKALESYQQALPLYRQVRNRKEEANTLNNIGGVYSDISQPQKALECYEQALPLFRQVGDKGGEAATLTNLGVVYSNIGESQRALEYYQEALPIHRQVGNKQFEANTLTNLGNVCRDTGQPQRTLEYYQQALPLYRQVGDKGGEANTLNGIGIVYDTIGQPQQGLKYFQLALPLFQQTGDKRGEAGTLSSIGNVCADIGQPQRALEYDEQALTIDRQLEDRHGEASVLSNIGTVYSIIGQSRKALEYYQQAQRLNRQVGDRGGVAITLNGIGSVYSDIGQPQKALDYFQQALPIYRQVGNKQGEASALGSLAALQEKQGHLADAQLHYQQAITLLETVRTNLGGLSEAKASFLASNLDTYYRSLALLLRQGKTQEAFVLAQKTKARALLDLLASGKVQLTQSLTEEERQKELQLRHKADQLNAEMVKESVQKRPGAAQRFEAFEEELARAESALQTYTDTLYARHPDLAKKRAAKTLTLPQVAASLPEDTALLEYVVLKAGKGKDVLDRTVLFVVTTQQGKPVLRTYPIPGRAADLSERADDFREACSSKQLPPYQSKARDLYQLLLAPEAKQLAGKRRLVLCPDGPLWGLPFQALLVPSLSPQGRLAGYGRAGQTGKPEAFLWERYELAYAYSATGAQAALTAKHGHPSASVLAFANPDFGDETRFKGAAPVLVERPFEPPSRPLESPSRSVETPAADSLLTERGGIAPLPGTQREADALARDFPAASVYTGKQAQEARMKTDAGRYRYLHFATHAFLNDAAPLLSSVVLAQPADDTEDGFLTAREIFEMNLSAEMVVLSACNTARGEKVSGEGIVGLTWSLFAAGCATQVVSQWSVDDTSTAVLMGVFYSGVKRGQGKGKALRSAGLSLMKDGAHAHPYYWAPFVLVGDWR